MLVVFACGSLNAFIILLLMEALCSACQHSATPVQSLIIMQSQSHTHSTHTHTHAHGFNDSGMRKRLALDFQISTNLSLRLSSLPLPFCPPPPQIGPNVAASSTISTASLFMDTLFHLTSTSACVERTKTAARL